MSLIISSANYHVAGVGGPASFVPKLGDGQKLPSASTYTSPSVVLGPGTFICFIVCWAAVLDITSVRIGGQVPSGSYGASIYGGWFWLNGATGNGSVTMSTSGGVPFNGVGCSGGIITSSQSTYSGTPGALSYASHANPYTYDVATVVPTDGIGIAVASCPQYANFNPMSWTAPTIRDALMEATSGTGGGEIEIWGAHTTTAGSFAPTFNSTSGAGTGVFGGSIAWGP